GFFMMSYDTAGHGLVQWRDEREKQREKLIVAASFSLRRLKPAATSNHSLRTRLRPDLVADLFSLDLLVVGERGQHQALELHLLRGLVGVQLQPDRPVLDRVRLRVAPVEHQYAVGH